MRCNGSFYGPRVWISLSAALCDIIFSLNAFERRLKTNFLIVINVIRGAVMGFCVCSAVFNYHNLLTYLLIWAPKSRVGEQSVSGKTAARRSNLFL